MNNSRGFTLIELIVVLALAGIVLSMIFLPIIFSYNNFDNQNEKTNIIADARATMDYLTREIRKSNDIHNIINNINENSFEITREIGGEIVVDKYEFKDGALRKNDKVIREGIYKLNITEPKYEVLDEEGNKKTIDMKTIKIEIVIKDNKDKEHNLTSEINIR